MSRRIALMTNRVGRAGAEIQVVRLAQRLRQRGDEVAVISILPFRFWQPELEAAGVETIELVSELPLEWGQKIPTSYGLKAVPRAVRALRAWRPGALLCFVHEASLFGRVVGSLARVPVIIGSERNEWQEGPLDRLVTRVTDPLLTLTTTNSRLVADDLVRHGVVRRSRLAVIPNGIDFTHWAGGHGRAGGSAGDRAGLRGELGVGPGEFLWLAVGRLWPQKDYPTLLAALKSSMGQPPAQLRVAGDGNLLDELEQEAQRLGLADRVRFLGVRTDVPELLGAADALVMASRHEGLSNAILEACAAGLPIVATHVGGTPELVTDGVNGFLVPPADPAALAQAMQRLAALPPERRAGMGAAGRRHVESYCGLDAVTQQWSDLIDAHRRRGGRGGRDVTTRPSRRIPLPRE